MTVILPLVVITPVLLLCAYCDLRYMQIPNKMVLILVALFVVTSPMLSIPEIGWRLAVSILVFGLGFAAFSFRLVGGGDVKMLAGLLLFIPSSTLLAFGYVFSAAMLLGIAVSVSLQNAPWSRDSDWVSIQNKGRFPMGISIALAGMLHPLVVLTLLQP